MNTIFALWLIASLVSMCFLAVWAYGNYQEYKSRTVLNRTRRVHCTHFVQIKDKV